MKQLARILLLAVIGASTLMAQPRATRAQQAAAAATEVKIFVPLSTDGTLNPSLQVRSRDSFPGLQCQAGSISTTRPDAWRCGTDDPCFAAPLSDPANVPVTLACAAGGPWGGSVQLLTVQTPLRGFDDCKSPPTCRQPLDLATNPWAIELSNGVRCTLLTGTISS